MSFSTCTQLYHDYDRRSELFIGFLNIFNGTDVSLIISHYVKGKWQYHKTLKISDKTSLIRDISFSSDTHSLLILHAFTKVLSIR